MDPTLRLLLKRPMIGFSAGASAFFFGGIFYLLIDWRRLLLLFRWEFRDFLSLVPIVALVEERR